MSDLLNKLKDKNNMIQKAIIEKEQHFKTIYDKTNDMLAYLCAEGSISARNALVEDLMAALAEFDGGEWNTKKMFPDKL